ncbi:MAG: nickel-dependent lactate racemase [Thermodesulfobacteriota bacterium]
MKQRIPYGRKDLEIEVPASHVTVLSPRFVPGLADEPGEFLEAVRKPFGTRPLRELVRPTDRVAVVVPDITRPFPSDRVLPWLFQELSHVPASRFVVINGTGTHRANTREELARMLGKKVVENYEVVNHNAYDLDTMTPVGSLEDGQTLYMNRQYADADRRVVLGFVEPHFFAGYSGGYKGIFPALADIDSILTYHRAAVIGDSRSTWGRLEGNPTQEQIRAAGSVLPVDFCANVSLNRRHEITRFFCGHVLQAHERGCAFVASTAMVPCEHPFPIVIATNGGYPLDQNLYQSVKGMSAAAQIVEPGGMIVMAAKCEDGFPAHGNFAPLLFGAASPQELLETISAPGHRKNDQWEAQKLASILVKARVALFSDLPARDVERAHMEPIDDPNGFLAEEVKRIGPDAPVAVLPEGPQTIPYLRDRGSGLTG